MKSKATAMAIVILLVTLWSTGWASGEQTRPKMWEYKVTLIGFNPHDQQILNQAGTEGWELVGVEPLETTSQAWAYFKRPK